MCGQKVKSAPINKNHVKCIIKHTGPPWERDTQLSSILLQTVAMPELIQS